MKPMKPMKYLKHYESEKFIFPHNFNDGDDPQVDDYVVIHIGYTGNTVHLPQYMKVFLNSNIAKIIKINNTFNDNRIIIKFNNIPAQFNVYSNAFDSGCFTIIKNDIYAISKNKKDLEQIIDANKFNL